MRGLLSHAVAYARKRHQHLRIDTHRDNAVMQKAINKAGFVYCGIIHCRDGSDRLLLPGLWVVGENITPI